MASQQRTKDHLLPPPPPPTAAASPTMSPQDRNESNATPANIEERRTPISPQDDSSVIAAISTAHDEHPNNNNASLNDRSEVTPAFHMRDISTIPPSSDHARHSPSPGVITSRRGRSRSPVASRPGSRASLRGDRSASADARGHNPPNGTLSEAAIAAGEAAIAAKRGPSPFVDYGRRSPSPTRTTLQDGHYGGRDRREGGFHGRDHSTTVNRWPSAEQSFECSPIAYNLSLGSFDWANGAVDHGHGNSGAGGYGHSNNGGGYHSAHQYKRYPSPPPEMRYDDQYYDERYRDRRHDDYNQRYYYDDRYDHHHDHRDYRHSDRYRRDDYHYSRHHRSRRDRTGSSRNVSPHSERRNSQPLYSEHHILSTSSYRDEDYSKNEDPRNHASFRDAPTPTAGNSRSRAQAGSVFRGVSETEYKSNVVPALRAVEEEVSPVSEGKFVEEGKKDAKKTKGKTGAKGLKKKNKKDSAVKTDLPKELMLGLDDESPPASPRKSSKAGRNAPSPIHAASPTNVDKELSAIGMDTLDVMNMMPGVDGDYLGNLSFRKSYDLEQMFSFMRSPKGSMKEAQPSHGMMDLKFGSMSFTHSFLMSGSGEEKNENDSSLRNDPSLKMRSHRRHPSSFGSHVHRRSRSPLFSGGIPTIHTLNSQTSSLGLTPINSFSGDNAPIVRLTSHDGMALHSFFASSPAIPDEGQDAGHSLTNPGMSMQQPPQQHGPPPMYGDYAPGPFRHEHRIATRGHPPPPPSAPTNAPHHGPVSSSNNLSAPNKRIKLMSSRLDTRPVNDVTKRADMFVLLKRLSSVFVGFQFKLPEVDLPLGESYTDNGYMPTDHQITLAKRRIFSSICAFGGCVPRRTVSYESDAELTPGQKRDKEDKILYDKELPSRYFMKEHCISWDVELHDVINPNSDNKDSEKNRDDSTTSAYCAPVTPSTPNNATNSLDGSGLREKGKKVKYRCKLCGQPKQNHTCPYQSTVMRSIGTMVYPAVNAFVSDEPGRLAPALSEMNNFTSLLSQDVSISGSTRDYRPYNNGFNVLTPDSHWSPNTPGGLSTISTPSTPGGHGAAVVSSRKRDHLSMSRTMSGVSTTGGVATGDDCLFRGTMELKPEQYRRVRFSVDSVTNAFEYPHIPTPYSQRKEMGDTLFALSREVPKLADACAAILREARENDCWDQAVAELTTQVLVILKCEEQDYALEGLKRHLLTLGIAC